VSVELLPEFRDNAVREVSHYIPLSNRG
jgi:hypothetical protein